METSILSGMCRCCALEGTFKDLKCTYHWMGEQEVYGDMLRECFNIDLSAEDGIDGGICEVCITQLRNAANFKKQVLYTEDQFKKRLQNKFFKASLVKVELPADDGPDSDDNENNLSEDEAFSNIEYEVPIKKEELDEPKPKKRAAKATTSRAKKAKADVGETSKRKTAGTRSVSFKTEVRKYRKRDDPKTDHYKDLASLIPKKQDIAKHMKNIDALLRYTNATPIKSSKADIGYTCCYCSNCYAEAADLKTHTLDTHADEDKCKFIKESPKDSTARGFLVRVDITSLTCDLCSDSIDSLEEAFEHLMTVHDIQVYADVSNQIMPFKFEGDTLKCAICAMEFNAFKMVFNHMHTHYMNYPCPKCDRAFINFTILRAHYSFHEEGEFACSYCSKVFDKMTKRNSHEKIHTGGNRYKCPHCDETFPSLYKKHDHMSQKHGVEPPLYTCNACYANFTRQRSLTVHIKKLHLLDLQYVCEYCDKRFFKNYDLIKHVEKHTKKKLR